MEIILKWVQTAILTTISNLLYAFCVTRLNTIHIWTCDEGNMEFYGSEAPILTEVKLRSILLPKIHKTHIDRHHRSIFASLSNVYGSSTLVYGYIARFSLIIYYHSLFYSLGHGATIVTSYWDVRYHSIT